MAAAAESPPPAGFSLSDAELLRYSRHILLDAIGIDGQRRLLAAHAVVVGAGGLGSPAAMYLASAGIGRITIVDDDSVELTNLQRQIAHATSRIGQPKADSAARTLAAINPGVRVDARVRRADAELLDALLPDATVVLDCSDNLATRHCVNAACVRHRVPLVAGAAVGLDGQLTVIDPRRPGAPCWACIVPPDSGAADADCATMGVFAPLVGIVGCMQAAEALKLVAGFGDALVGRLLMVDALSMRFDAVAVARRPGCPVCGGLSSPP